MSQKTAGLIQLQVNGQVYSAKGEFTYNLGLPLREPIIGSDGVHGFKETPQVPFIEGEITDRGDVDVKALAQMEDATVTLQLANGKLIVLNEGWYAGEGTASTGEGNVGFRFEGETAEEIS